MEQSKQNNLAIHNKQNNEFWEGLAKAVNIEVYGIKANPVALQKILTGEGRSARDNHDVVLSMFIDVAEMFFGANIGKLNENLWINTYNRLIKMFPNVTVEEIEEAYKSQEILKPYGNLTVGELLQPIMTYQAVKNSANKQLQKAKEDEEEQTRFKREEQAHKDNSIKVYQDSLKCGEWKGTPMQAHTLVMGKMLNYNFILKDESLQKELKEKAQLMYNKHKIEMKKGGVPYIKPSQFLSEQTVLECLKKKKLVIVNH